MDVPTTAANLETPRLRKRPFTPDDLDDLAKLYGDPDVMRFIGLRNREETAVALAAMVDHWKEHGFGIWALFTRDDGRFVGRCGLRRQPELADVELAYTLHKEYWNRGLATEAAKASVAWGFAKLGLERVISFALPANRGSTRVMEKIGMRFEKRGPWKELDHAWYAVARAEFAAAE